MTKKPAIWFPAIRTGTGTDVFTTKLCDGLLHRNIRAEVSWLPHRTEFAPWSVQAINPPSWANIAHVNTWLPSKFIPVGLPIVATMHLCVHDTMLMQYKSPLQAIYHKLWIKSLERQVLSSASRLVAVSEYTAKQTQENFKIENIDIIRNGVSIPENSSIKNNKSPHEPFRLLYVGNWSRRKGVDLLAPLMKMLGDEFELWYTTDSRGAHKNFKIPPNVKCLGRLNSMQLNAVYADVDVLIFPSRLEGLPLTVLEAMACGLPVVASRSSSLPELIDSHQNGMLFEPNSVESAAELIRELRKNPDFSRSIGVNAHQTALTKFDMNVMVDAYVDLYQDMC